MKKLLPIIILFSALCQSVIANEAILRLETGGHTTIINDIIVTKSGDIISASDDKTIRVWDSLTGREKRKILGQIGDGPEGKIFAIALSPDEEYLAVGGYLGNSINTVGSIRIFHYPTGKLIKLLKSHTNVVLDLAFSEDGHYLISGSNDETAKIWEVSNDFSLEDTIDFHSKEIYAVKIIKKRGKYFSVTAGFDQQIALYDIQKREVVKSHRSKYLLQYLATASNLFSGRIAVCGFGKEILIYDFNLNFIKKVKTKTEPSGLSYSADGKLLISGIGSHPFNVNIYRSKKNYLKKTSFKKHTNLTQAVAFFNNHTAVSGGGDNNEIYLWDTQTAKVKKKIVGVGDCVWSVGIKGNSIAWGNDWTGDVHTIGSKLQKTFNLRSFELDESPSSLNSLKRNQRKKGSYSLSHKSGGDYGYNDAVLVLKKDSKVVTSITKDFTDGNRHNCYSIYKDMIVSGGSNGRLKIYNFEGKKIADLVGHTGGVWSIAVDGDRLVSGSDDQSIRIWDLSKLTGGEESEATLHPMLNIIIVKNREWVIWSNSGYFASSVNGDKYVGYHINQGRDKEAHFVSSAKYYDKLYRPDIIEAIVKTGSEEKAIESISSKRKVEKPDIISEMPPIITLLSESALTTTSGSTTVNFAIESSTPVEKLIVIRNGVQVKTEILPSGKIGSITIDLEEGENIIAIRAKNQYALSDALLVHVTRTVSSNKRAAGTRQGSELDKQSSESIYKPTLYLLSIGVSRYKNSTYNLEVADVDAQSIVKMFKKQEGKIYNKVVTRQLLNDNANKDNILEALDWIERETTQRDMVIIFVAGHGINDDKGNYYFMAHDSDVNKLRRTAIRWIEIKDTISDLPSKVILMVDTCHSGNIMGQERRRDITGAIKSIINSGTGSVIMTASTGRGYSIENNSWGHGAFTKALLEGIDEAKADYNHNQTISIKEIDLYVTERVKILTKGKQKPTTIIPDSVPDFALGVQ